MGTTGYQNMTTAQAVAYDLRECDVLASSGQWRLYTYTTSDGDTHTDLAHCITSRDDGWAYVKIVPACMGPCATPPRAIFRRYVGMVPEPANQYEAEWREKVTREHDTQASRPAVKPGDTFAITSTPYHAGKWSDGVPVPGTYQLVKGYTARRFDGVLVTLPKAWRRHYVYEAVAA
jgi:hypothetical protein